MELKKKCSWKIDWERNIAKNHFYTYLHKLGKANQLSYDRFMVNVVEAVWDASFQFFMS